jgi:hypothetical protein
MQQANFVSSTKLSGLVLTLLIQSSDLVDAGEMSHEKTATRFSLFHVEEMIEFG